MLCDKCSRNMNDKDLVCLILVIIVHRLYETWKKNRVGQRWYLFLWDINVCIKHFFTFSSDPHSDFKSKDDIPYVLYGWYKVCKSVFVCQIMQKRQSYNYCHWNSNCIVLVQWNKIIELTCYSKCKCSKEKNFKALEAELLVTWKANFKQVHISYKVKKGITYCIQSMWMEIFINCVCCQCTHFFF